MFDELIFCLQRLYCIPFHLDMPFNDTILEEITTVEVYKKREHCQNCACTRTPTSGSEVRDEDQMIVWPPLDRCQSSAPLTDSLDLYSDQDYSSNCFRREAEVPGCPPPPARPAVGGAAGQASPGSRGRSLYPRGWRTNCQCGQDRRSLPRGRCQQEGPELPGLPSGPQ